MKKSIFFKADIHETGIKAGHQFLYPSQIHISHIEGSTSPFFLKFHQRFIFKECDGNLFGLYVYYQFACHFCILKLFTFLIKQRTNPKDFCCFARFVLYLSSQTDYKLFFAFMSVLSQSFFTLVSRHFVSFLLLSAWHSFKFYGLILLFIISLLIM